MTTREKIIVVIMCLAILYGGYDLFRYRGRNGSGPQTDAGPPKDDLRGFVAEISRKLLNESVSEEFRHLIAQAGADWTKDPFINSSGPLSSKAPAAGSSASRNAPEPAARFSYTGYLSIGDRCMAIINGMEYAAGEALIEKGYVLADITPLHVVIVKDGKEKLNLPLLDAD